MEELNPKMNKKTVLQMISHVSGTIGGFILGVGLTYTGSRQVTISLIAFGIFCLSMLILNKTVNLTNKI